VDSRLAICILLAAQPLDVLDAISPLEREHVSDSLAVCATA
jgi:hypothetical protein